MIGDDGVRREERAFAKSDIDVALVTYFRSPVSLSFGNTLAQVSRLFACLTYLILFLY